MENKDQKPNEIIKRALEGRMALELYPGKGYVVTLKIKEGTYFFWEFEVLKGIVDDFSSIVKVKGKPNEQKQKNIQS